MQIGIFAPMVVQFVSQERIDFKLRIDTRTFRPGNAKLITESVHKRPRIRQKLLVAQPGALHVAGSRLGIQHMTQPHKVPNRRVDSVAYFQGCSDVKRIADRRDNQRFGAEAFRRLDPEGQQSAYPWVLQHEQTAVTILAFKHRPGAFTKFVGNRGGVPCRIERPPITPGRSRGRKNIVVEMHDRQRFPKPRLVVARALLHQRARQPAPHEAQHTGHRRRTASVHSGHHDRGLGHVPAP